MTTSNWRRQRGSGANAVESRLEHEFRGGTRGESSGISVAPSGRMRATAEPVRSEVTAVTIVATNPETLDSLQSYLRGAGLGARCTRDLAECTQCAAESDGKLAVVIFPDDFRWEKVAAALARLAALRRPVLTVLVTAHPQKLEKVRPAEDIVIMPRPVWGWKILDAIRAPAQHDESARREGARAR